MSDVIYNNEKSVGSKSMGYFFLYFFIALLVLTAILFLLKGAFFDKRTSDASILKNELYANENVVFSDNTKGAKKWLWEFGDGAKSTARSGIYRYHKSGPYIIRLTIDGDMKVQFPVTVKDTVTANPDTTLTINGPTSGVVNEEVRLEALGQGTQFEWSFGETGRVDVKGKTALYTFHSPGTFRVQLRSERSRPVTHTIHVTDPSLDTVLVIPGEGERKIVDDIRARLQAIANGADFNSNYYYLTHTYLCNNEKVAVAIDQDSIKRSTDFYSYCMALTFDGEVSIDQAQLTISANSSCATLLNIKQHSAKTARK